MKPWQFPSKALTGAKVPMLDALSPSKAKSHRSCPAMFYTQWQKAVPNTNTIESARGTVFHLVAEKLLTYEPQERTPEAANALIEEAWNQVAQEPASQSLVDGPSKAIDQLFAHVESSIANWFVMEDVASLTNDSSQLEQWVRASLGGINVRGIIDRVDTSFVDGRTRYSIVDYKTGNLPKKNYETMTWYAMKLYAAATYVTVLAEQEEAGVPVSERIQPSDIEMKLIYVQHPEEGTFVKKFNASNLTSTKKMLSSDFNKIRSNCEAGSWSFTPNGLCENYCEVRRANMCPQFSNFDPSTLPAGTAVSEPVTKSKKKAKTTSNSRLITKVAKVDMGGLF